MIRPHQSQACGRISRTSSTEVSPAKTVSHCSRGISLLKLLLLAPSLMIYSSMNSTQPRNPLAPAPTVNRRAIPLATPEPVVGEGSEYDGPPPPKSNTTGGERGTADVAGTLNIISLRMS